MQKVDLIVSPLDSLRSLLSPPIFPDDEEQTRIARGLQNLLTVNAIIALLSSLVLLLVDDYKLTALVALFVTFAPLILCFILNRRGNTRLASIIYLCYFWLLISVMMLFTGGLSSIIGLLYIPIIVLSLLFLGWRASLVSLLAALIYIVALAAYGSALPNTFPPSLLTSWGVIAVTLLLTLTPIYNVYDELISLHKRLAEQQKSEKILYDSEERYRLIASVTSDYTFSSRFDNQGGLYDYNFSGAFEAVSGYTPDEFVAIGGWPTIVHPDDREQDARDVAMLRESNSISTEIRIIRKDGQPRWVHIYGYPLWDNAHQNLVGIYGAVLDIHERKLAEQALQESEERFRLISTVTSDYSFSTRFDVPSGLEHTVYGGAFEVITGYTPKEFDQAGGWIAVVHPDDLEHDNQDMETLRQNKTVISELRIIRKDGQIRWVRTYGYPLWDAAQQKLIGIYGAVQDITDRKLTEQALQESVEGLRIISSITSDYTYSSRFNAEGKLEIKALTGAFSTITGYTPDEFVQLGGWQAILHPDDRAQNESSGEKLRQNQSTVTEARIFKKDGTMRWVRIYGYPVWDAVQNKLLGVNGAVQDITDRKLAEQALLESESRYRLVSESISDYAYAYDIHPDGSFSCYWITEDSFMRLTGYTWIETGTTFDLYHPDDAPIVQEHVHQTIAGNATSGEYRIITKSGETRWVSIRRQVEWDENQKRFVRFYGAAQDITERKQAERALAKDRKLLRSVIDQLPDNIFVKDREGRFLLNNAASMQILGVTSQEELLGKTDFDFFPYEPAQEWHERIQRVINFEESIIDHEIFQPTFPDKQRWLLHTSIPLYDENGQVIGSIGINRDITERKLAERAVAQERKLLRTVIDHMPDNIFVKDKEGRFLLNNTVSISLLGVSSQEELLGKSDFDFYSAELAQEWLDLQQQTMQSGVPILDLEVFQPQFTSKNRWILHSRIPLLDDKGEVTGVLGINRDITERKQAERAIAQERLLLRTVIDQQPDNIFVKDRNSKFLLNNAESMRILGVSKQEDLLGKDDFDFLPREVAQKWFDSQQGVMDSGEPVINREVFQPWHKNKRRWVLFSSIPLRDENGVVTGLLGVDRDISEQKRSEEALREKEAFLRVLLDATSNIVFLMTVDGRFLTANRPMAASIGMTVESLLGVNGFDFIPPELREERLKHFKTCVETAQPVHWEDHATNGWWDNTIYPVLSMSGEVEAFAVYSVDVTEQKRLAAELQRYATQLEQMVEERTAELRRAKEQIEIILNNTRDAVALAQSNGDIENRNPAFISMFGDQVSNWIERLLSMVATKEQGASVSKALVNTIHNQEGQRVELQLTAENDRNKDIDLAFIPVRLTDEQQQSGILVSAHDITHIKQIERFKTKFIDDAVHDLATPIAGLTTRLYLLKRSPEKLDDHLRKLENQVGHLRNLLDDLRSLSQLDRGQLTLTLEWTDANQMVARVFDTYEPVAISKGQTLNLITDSHLPQIQVDTRQMERVFVNLVANAINYTQNNKPIVVQTALDEDAVIFSVTDQGMGISPQDLPHIFERFYRSENARSSQSGGTGLGLAIVKEIVERHGGQVSAISELGKGSTFIVRLPIKQVA